MIDDPATDQAIVRKALDEPRPIEETLKPRKHLRFPGIHHNARPHGYLHIHQALDQLGEARYPLEWGRAVGFSRLPYQYVIQHKKFYTYKLQRQKRRLLLIGEPHAVPVPLREPFRHLDKIYRSLRDELRHALEAKTVEAKKLVRMVGLVEMGNPGIWASHMRSIFYLGVLPESVDGREISVTVLVSEPSFQRWLIGAPIETDTGTVSNAAGSASKINTLTDEVLRSIADHVKRHNYRLPWPDFLSNVKRGVEEAGRSISNKEVGRIWRNPILEHLKRSGASSTQEKENFRKSREDLVETIKAMILAPSRLLKKSERRHTAPANAQTAMRFPYSVESIFR